MFENAGVWILRLTGAAMVSAAAVSLTPKGPGLRVVRLACGLLSVSVLLGAAFSDADGKTAFPPEAYAGEATASASSAEDAIRAVIETHAEAYISDKAAALGLTDFAVKLTAEKAPEGWYFSRAELTGAWDAAAEKELSRQLAETLGIAEEDQEWRSVDKGP